MKKIWNTNSSHWTRAVLSVALLTAVAAGFSCTNSDPLSTGQSVVFTIEAAGDSRFEFAEMNLVEVTFLPVNGGSALNGGRLAVSPPQGALFDFKTNPSFSQPLAIAVGSYQLTGVLLTNDFFFDEDLAGAMSDCTDQNFYTGFFQTMGGNRYQLDIPFTVTASTNSVRVVVDEEQFIAALGGAAIAPACFQLNSGNFATLLGSAITVETN